MDAIEPLNTKYEQTLDYQFNNVIDAAFKLGGVLFLTATHLAVARTLRRRCEDYSKCTKTEDGSDE